MKMDDLLIFMMLDEHKKLKMKKLQFERIPSLVGCPIPLQHFRLSRSTAQTLDELLGNCSEIPLPRERVRPTVDVENSLS